jgi:hypothetical protein
MKTRLEILCELHGQQGGTIHQFDKQYGLDILGLSNRAFFKLVYSINLKKAHSQYPDQYSWPSGELLNVYERMCAAIDRMSFNKDSHAIRWTCKALGIKHTYREIGSFFTSEATQ